MLGELSEIEEQDAANEMANKSDPTLPVLKLLDLLQMTY